MTGPDWKLIREEYITTNVGYRKLSEKWGVSFNTLKDRAKREMWFSKRERYRADVATETLRAVGDYTIKSDADKLIKLKRASDSLADLINAVLEDSGHLKRAYLDEEGRPSFIHDITSTNTGAYSSGAPTQKICPLPTFFITAQDSSK